MMDVDRIIFWTIAMESDEPHWLVYEKVVKIEISTNDYWNYIDQWVRGEYDPGNASAPILANSNHGDEKLDIETKFSNENVAYAFKLPDSFPSNEGGTKLRFRLKRPFQFGMIGFFNIRNIIVEDEETYSNGLGASFVINNRALQNAREFKTLKNKNVKLLKIPMSFNLDDIDLDLSPAIIAHADDHKRFGLRPISHGGPHPPISSSIYVPTS